MDQGIEVGVTAPAVEAALHLGESIGDPALLSAPEIG
jgi:hypothetical protein